MSVNITGVTPKAQGDNWFLIDQSGTFYLDKTVKAKIWLVGGGCDGADGSWIGYDMTYVGSGGSIGFAYEKVEGTGTDTSIAGKGGDGGYVTIEDDLRINKSTECVAVVAPVNNKSGTTLKIGGATYKCNDSGQFKAGGIGGTVKLDTSVTKSGNGVMGWDTVCSYSPGAVVGSSGGGGHACNGYALSTNLDTTTSGDSCGGTGAGGSTNFGNHREKGDNATNYGCGGGGGSICAIAIVDPDDTKNTRYFEGGDGMQGCIIVQYEEIDDEYNLVVKCEPSEGGDAYVKGNDLYFCDDSITIDALNAEKFLITPQENTGYEFTRITSSDVTIEDGCHFTMIPQDVTVIVHFEKPPERKPEPTPTTSPPIFEKEPEKYVIQRYYKRVTKKKNKRNDNYYSSSNKHTCCGNGSCGCGGSKSTNAADYTDTIHIGSGKVK